MRKSLVIAVYPSCRLRADLFSPLELQEYQAQAQVFQPVDAGIGSVIVITIRSPYSRA